MKNSLLKYTFILLAVASFVTACKEHEEVLPATTPGVLLQAKAVAGKPTYFDFSNLSAAQIGFTVSALGEGSAASFKVMKRFNGSGEILHGTYSSLPGDVLVTSAEAIAGFTNGAGAALTTDSINLGDVFYFTLIAVTSDGKEIRSSRSTAIFTVPVSCPSDLAGSYARTTTYGFHDFLPDFATYTDTVDLTEVGDGKYSIVDFTGGLYSVGPYSVEYGTTAVGATIQEVCGKISWTDVKDPYGSVVQNPDAPQSAVGANGTITISFKCLGYGEYGTSVYTPL